MCQRRIGFSTFSVIAICLLALLSTTSWVNGATISDANGPVVWGPPFITITPGNDDAASSGNFGAADITFAVADPIVIDFDADNSPSGVGEVTEYAAVFILRNNTGIDWTGFRVELSSDPSVPGLDFDTVTGNEVPVPGSEPNIGGNPADIHLDQILEWTDNPIPDGDSPNLFLAFDVPNFDSAAEYEFTMRFEPLYIPEPASLALVVLLGAVRLLRPATYKPRRTS